MVVQCSLAVKGDAKNAQGLFLPATAPSPDQIAPVLFSLGREVKQRRRLRKHHLKSEFALLQTLTRLFHLVQFVKFWRIFSGAEV